MNRSILLTAATAVAALSLTACGASSDPTAPAAGGGAAGGSTASGGSSGAIVVGSADFSESQVLGEVYAGALKAKGVNVSTKPNIGSRDVYIKALQDGSIDLVPEYTGSLLTFLKGTAPSQDPDAVYSTLKTTLPAALVVLDKSAAQDKNSMVVTKDTASKYSLKSIADLAAHQGDITVAAPPEFQTRQQGLVGLKDQYGFTPKAFLPLKGAAIVNALTNGQAQAANIFSTDPSITSNGFVTLEDPKLLFGSDNVVPLVRKDKVNDTITSALNAVSAKIDTATLTDLVKQVDVDKKDASVVAKAFLSKNGLG
jgi:osmoprotectant transport system substrate-binding protein